jgi:hypothetical protein
MALATKTLAQGNNGSYFVEVDYQDTNELVEAVRWANNDTNPVNYTIRRTDTGATISTGTLMPGTNGSAQFSGGDRFKLEFYNVPMARWSTPTTP